MCPHRLCGPRCKSALTAPLWMNSAASAHRHPTPHSSLQGYSFVAPSILFDHNNAVMADVLQAPGAGYRPGRAAVARSAMMQVGWPGGGGGIGFVLWGEGTLAQFHRLLVV